MKKVAETHLKWTPYFMLSVASKAKLRLKAHKQRSCRKRLPEKAAAELSTLQ